MTTARSILRHASGLTLRFYASYLWLLMRHGYDNHPMEIEARKAEVA